MFIQFPIFNQAALNLKKNIYFGMKKSQSSLSLPAEPYEITEDGIVFSVDGQRYITTPDKKGRLREQKLLQSLIDKRKEITELQTRLEKGTEYYHERLADLKRYKEILSKCLQTETRSSQAVSDSTENFMDKLRLVRQIEGLINNLQEKISQEELARSKKEKNYLQYLAEQNPDRKRTDALLKDPAKAIQELHKSPLTEDDDLSKEIPERLTEIQSVVNWFVKACNGNYDEAATIRERIIARFLRDFTLKGKQRFQQGLTQQGGQSKAMKPIGGKFPQNIHQDAIDTIKDGRQRRTHQVGERNKDKQRAVFRLKPNPINQQPLEP